MRETGSLKFCNSEKGFGFTNIQRDPGERGRVVLTEGAAVSFEAKDTERGLRAMDVVRE